MPDNYKALSVLIETSEDNMKVREYDALVKARYVFLTFKRTNTHRVKIGKTIYLIPREALACDCGKGILCPMIEQLKVI